MNCPKGHGPMIEKKAFDEHTQTWLCVKCCVLWIFSMENKSGRMHKEGYFSLEKIKKYLNSKSI